MNLDRLVDLFPEGGDISVADLVDKGAVRANQPVKILGNGSIDIAINVTATAISKSAQEKISAAGGSFTIG